jgi:hypothetical protein
LAYNPLNLTLPFFAPSAMPDPSYAADSDENSAFSQESMRAILLWLGTPAPANAADQLAPLQNHLAVLRSSQITAQQRASVFDSLYARGILITSALLPSLVISALPIPRKTRHLIRNLHNLLVTLAEELQATLHTKEGISTFTFQPADELALWRKLYVLSLHLLISHLVAAPAVPGIWRELHQTFERACQGDICNHTPQNAVRSLQDVYYTAVLLGCAQPASFTSYEITSMATYLDLFVDQVEVLSESSPKTPATFWIDPERDTPAIACARKSAPPDTLVHYFSCDRLARLMKEQLAALGTGQAPHLIGLPAFAETPSGQSILRRILFYWEQPGKRRFPRRRQSYRAALCSGLDNLWLMFQPDKNTITDTSIWMITNESPDGYALMHLSGKSGQLYVGDIAAIRTESGDSWQICIVRWALSENQEHLELGLQILATRAIPAIVALPDAGSAGPRLSSLILPGIPPLRPSDLLVVPAGTLEPLADKFVLLLEKENLEVREVRSTRLEQQSSLIDIFSIETDSSAT